MKPVDDDTYLKISEETIDSIRTGDIVTPIGKHNLLWPKSLRYNLAQDKKYWNADDIADVIKNYDLISKTTKIVVTKKLGESLDNLFDQFKNINHLNDKEMNEVLRDFAILLKVQDEISKASGLNDINVNNNIVSLNNVYLGDCKFSSIDLYDRCDLTIKDQFNNTIPGVLFYSSIITKANPDNILVDNWKIINSLKNYAVPYDIDFEALPYMGDLEAMVLDKPKAVNKNPILGIRTITRLDGYRTKTNPVDVGTYVPQLS